MSRINSEVKTAAGGKGPQTREAKAKKQGIRDPIPADPGTVFTCGRNDVGQLGMQDIYEVKYPSLVIDLEPENINGLSCGAMHTVVLTSTGQVYTFGCNDDNALGRPTEDDDDMAKPGIVAIPGVVTQISAGLSHTAALTEDHRLFLWGSFRGESGKYGLLPNLDRKGSLTPIEISFDAFGTKPKKVVSGDNHIAVLCDNYMVYTMGTGDYGQLGRITKDEALASQDGTLPPQLHEEYKRILLRPRPMDVLRHVKFDNVWAGPSATICQVKEQTDVFVCGRNSYGQLGIRIEECVSIFKPMKRNNFRNIRWQQIAIGNDHTLCLDQDGVVYALGRNEDGRLGLGDAGLDAGLIVATPTAVTTLKERIVSVATGSDTSYAISKWADLYAWGVGDLSQLASGSEEHEFSPIKCKTGDGEELKAKVVLVDGGAQHSAIVISKKRKPPVPHHLIIYAELLTPIA